MNICQTFEFDDSFFFRSVCDCARDDHGQQLVVEIDKDGYYVSCTIYQDLFWMERNMHDVTWHKRIWFRIKNATKYLFTGHVRVCGEHLLAKEQHIRDYANAMLGAIDELKSRRERYLSSMQEKAGNDQRGRTPSSAEDLQGKADSPAA
jgi:hypothetical protein